MPIAWNALMRLVQILPIARRSAGVAVSERVYRTLKSARAAMDRREWHRAIEHLRHALDEDPSLRHIWIQLGHALRETGVLSAAVEAYERAEALGDKDGDAALFLGHSAKAGGRLAEATQFYLRAIQRNAANADALGELQLIAERRWGGSIDRAAVLAALRGSAAASGGEGGERPILQTLAATVSSIDDQPRQDSAAATAPIVFDASDLISYFRNARLPTGIQRVQIEVIRSTLSDADPGAARICYFSDLVGDWLEVPGAEFLSLAELASTSGDRTAPDWLAALGQLRATLAFAEPMQMPQGAVLVNLGTSWWLQNYFLFVRHAKTTRGLRYVPFVHDFIPVMAPEHCVTELTQDFITWALGVFAHADFFLVNSEATKRDLLKVAALLGYAVDAASVTVIRLDADFRRQERATLPVVALDRWQLVANGYVLFVSTVESRKNHGLAFDAWLDLIERHGVEGVPKLVCVGNRGWLNDAVYARLEQNAVLRGSVVMLQHLSDDELALLYQNCRFTLYPSSYEGWGLPVTESLSYGKVPVLSDASSLPEAGGAFGEYFVSGDRGALVAVLDRMMFDDDYRDAREAAIISGFVPRSWSDVAEQVAGTVRDLARHNMVVSMEAPLAQAGRYHPIVRNLETRIWAGQRSGEIFRAGTQWWWPDDWGCWTKGPGELRLALPDDVERVKLHLRLYAPPGMASRYSVALLDEGSRFKGSVPAGGISWVSFVVDRASLPDGRTLRLVVTGDGEVDLAPLTGGVDTRVVSIGVGGFFLSDALDMSARMDFVEAVTLSNLDQIAFGREILPAATTVADRRERSLA